MKLVPGLVISHITKFLHGDWRLIIIAPELFECLPNINLPSFFQLKVLLMTMFDVCILIFYILNYVLLYPVGGNLADLILYGINTGSLFAKISQARYNKLRTCYLAHL